LIVQECKLLALGGSHLSAFLLWPAVRLLDSGGVHRTPETELKPA
jgi:hypothetical protein